MKIKIEATENVQRLKQNLEKRVEDAEIKEGSLVVETEKTGFLEKTPGIERFKVDGEEKEGIGGKPVEEEAYVRIESCEDAVKAFLATLKGYDLRVLETDREWDLKNLKKYNPNIKHLRFEKPREFLGIDKAVQEINGTEKIEIELPEEKAETVYQEMLN